MAHQPTCLFTGAPLFAATREEHTIPRALCGRIRSRVVSSDKFNNDCGSHLDSTLILPYARILNRLEPLLAGEYAQGPLHVAVPGEPDGLILEAGGIPSRRGRTILSRDPVTNRPTSAVSADEKSLRQLANQLGQEDSIQISTVPVTQGASFHNRTPVILAEIEIAALKCGLLSFDHFLQAHRDAFTRSKALFHVRRFIADAVAQRRIDGDGCHRHSLGLQYERAEMYQRLRSQLPVVVSPFEHVLLVASHRRTRYLDLVWIVFGFDPFGFRLCSDWRGPDVSLGIVNGILSGESASAAITFVAEDAPLCKRTWRRAFPDRVPQAKQSERIMEEIRLRRDDAFQRAVLILEERGDAFVRENILEAANLAPVGERSLHRLILQRLCNMYGRRKDDPTLVRLVDETVSRQLTELAVDIRGQQIQDPQSAASVSWDAWLQLYRHCLAAMTKSVGLPGDPFLIETEVGTDRVDTRRLGTLPGRGING